MFTQLFTFLHHACPSGGQGQTVVPVFGWASQGLKVAQPKVTEPREQARGHLSLQHLLKLYLCMSSEVLQAPAPPLESQGPLDQSAKKSRHDKDLSFGEQLLRYTQTLTNCSGLSSLCPPEQSIIVVTGQWRQLSYRGLEATAEPSFGTLDSQLLPAHTGTVVIQGAWAESQREFSTCLPVLSVLWSGAWTWGGAGPPRSLE